MSETVTPIIALEEGKTYVAQADDFLITRKHSGADILRFLVDCIGIEDVRYMVENDYRDA